MLQALRPVQRGLLAATVPGNTLGQIPVLGHEVIGFRVLRDINRNNASIALKSGSIVQSIPASSEVDVSCFNPL